MSSYKVDWLDRRKGQTKEDLDRQTGHGTVLGRQRLGGTLGTIQAHRRGEEAPCASGSHRTSFLILPCSCLFSQGGAFPGKHYPTYQEAFCLSILSNFYFDFPSVWLCICASSSPLLIPLSGEHLHCQTPSASQQQHAGWILEPFTLYRTTTFSMWAGRRVFFQLALPSILPSHPLLSHFAHACLPLPDLSLSLVFLYNF